MAATRTPVLRLIGDAIPQDEVTVLAMEGREAIGELFRFELTLETERDDWDLGELLTAPCRLEFGQGVMLPGTGDLGLTMLPVHGVLSKVEQLHRRDTRYLYRATLVPVAWRLTLSRRCRTFLEMSIPDILRRVLEDGGLPSDQMELRLNASYPTLPVVNQYQESDLDFAARLMEHEGISYFFEHGSEHATMVLADNQEAFPEVAADPQLPYRPDATGWNADGGYAGSFFEAPSIRRMTCTQKPLPEKVVLQDYQHEQPTIDLKSEADVAADARFGTRYEYGHNYPDPDAGSRYARMRSEELACRQKVFEGTTSSRALRAGAILTPQEHFRDSFNQELLLVAVKHHAAGTLDTMAYHASFKAVPRDVPFRPKRRTPKPSITGVLPATVDAVGDGQYAEVDADGSYRVKFPFDLEDRADGQASSPLRMGQPYGGSDMGLHYPLHKGVEVTIGFIHGDPDRPYITGSLPNPQNPSQITDANHTECVLRSGGENSIVFDDTDGSQRFDVNASHDRSLTVANNNTESVGAAESLTVSGKRTVTVKKDQEHTIEENDTTTVHKDQSLTLSGGNRTVTITGDESTTISGTVDTTIGTGRTLTVSGGNTETLDGGHTQTVTGGSTETITGGETRTIDGGSTKTISGTDGTTVNGDLVITASAGGVIDTGPSMSISAASITLEANASITLHCSGSTISITPSGITISAPMVECNAAGMLNLNGSVINNNT